MADRMKQAQMDADDEDDDEDDEDDEDEDGMARKGKKGSELKSLTLSSKSTAKAAAKAASKAAAKAAANVLSPSGTPSIREFFLMVVGGLAGASQARVEIRK